MRQFDPRRDLIAVADLVELCFAENLDIDSRRFIQRMRMAAQNPGLFGWRFASPPRAFHPYSGYVWEQDGGIVGNLNLIQHPYRGGNRYIIANVSVHPDYRSRGIANTLTAEALRFLSKKGVVEVWLQVRQNNPAAVKIYANHGFREMARRTTWKSKSIHSTMDSTSEPMAGLKISTQSKKDWGQHRNWLSSVYPPDVKWLLPINFNAFRPGILGGMYRFVNDIRIKHWCLYQNGRLLGVISWQASHRSADYLWLAIPETNDKEVIAKLMPHVRKRMPRKRDMTIDFPGDRSVEALQDAGFKAQQTLIWMRLLLR